MTRLEETKWYCIDFICLFTEKDEVQTDASFLARLPNQQPDPYNVQYPAKIVEGDSQRFRVEIL